jgi:alkylated DNA nucleotide flippase Atl1
MVNRGLVEHLFRKKERKKPVLAFNRLNLLAGYGIEGDLNSDRHSPRQLLVVDGQDLNRLSIPPGELRENIVLNQLDATAFKPGAKLTFPSGAAIRLTFYCEPCKQIAHLVESLKSIQQKRGILGVVVKGGEIVTGDRVLIQPNCFPALSEIPYERFLELVKRIPQGKVITYKQILTSIGVDKSYYRVMPLYLKKTPQDYPIHRVLDSHGHTISHIAQQRAKLEAEGIEVSQKIPRDQDSYSVSLKKYAWHNSTPWLKNDECPGNSRMGLP